MTLEKIGSMGGIAFLVFAILSILLAALLGLKRGVFKSAVRTVSLFASAFVSLFLVKMLLPSLLKVLTEKILQSLSDSEGALKDILQAETSFAVLEALVLAVVAPLIFMLVYFIVNKLFLIVCFIVNLVLKPMTEPVEKKIPCRRLFGALISVVGALVTLVVISTPIAGYTEMLDHTVAHIESPDSAHDDSTDGVAKTLHDIEPLTHGFADSVAVSIPYKMGGNLFYKSLTSIHIEKNAGVIDKAIDTSLEKELIGVLDLLPIADSFGDISFADIEGMNIDPLRKVAETLDDQESSAIVRVMMADIFSTASNRWLKGETYLTIDLMGLLQGDAAMFRPSVEVILSGLADTHVSSIGQDVIVLVETFDGIQKTFLYMMVIADSVEKGEIAKVEDVVNMLESLTPQSAAAMSASMTDIMKTTGIGDEYAESLGGILTSALGEMAELNQDKSEEGQEHVHKEAAALNTVLTLAMNPDVEMTEDMADDLIESVMDSTILKHSIQNGVKEAEDDSVPTMALPEESADKVQAKIDAYEAANELDEEQKDTLDSLRTFFATKTVVEGEENEGGNEQFPDLNVGFGDLENS